MVINYYDNEDRTEKKLKINYRLRINKSKLLQSETAANIGFSQFQSAMSFLILMVEKMSELNDFMLYAYPLHLFHFFKARH